MSLQELGNLAITQVQWNSIETLGFTLNDGKTCRAGKTKNFNYTHNFKQSKKITKIITTIGENEGYIIQINFFSGEERLCSVGMGDDYAKRNGGRVVTFEIAADEQLIGCELDHGTYYEGEGDSIEGVTWLKWKIIN